VRVGKNKLTVCSGGGRKTDNKMKVTLLKIALFTALVTLSISSFAQVSTIYVVKNGTVIPVSGIESVVFNGTTSSDTLFVQKNSGFLIDKTSLDNIQQLIFSSENMSIETISGNNVEYELKDIAKLLFKNVNATGVNNPSVQSSFDVLAYISSSGDMVVESPVAIKSLTLFNIEGKMISTQQYSAVEMQRILSLQNISAGIYLLQVETGQGTIVKKIIKPSNN